MRTTSPVVAEDFGLGLGFDPSRPIPAKPLTTNTHIYEMWVIFIAV